MDLPAAPRCVKHPNESAAHCFSCYLSQPCDEEGCDSTATHNQPYRLEGRKFCNQHTDWTQPMFARDD